MISLNGSHWFKAGSYRYCAPKISKMLYTVFKETDTLEERQKILSEPGPLTDNEKIFMDRAGNWTTVQEKNK